MKNLKKLLTSKFLEINNIKIFYLIISLIIFSFGILGFEAYKQLEIKSFMNDLAVTKPIAILKKNVYKIAWFLILLSSFIALSSFFSIYLISFKNKNKKIINYPMIGILIFSFIGFIYIIYQNLSKMNNYFISDFSKIKPELKITVANIFSNKHEIIKILSWIEFSLFIFTIISSSMFLYLNRNTQSERIQI